MNLHHLSLFFAIAEVGNISEASKRLFISQPALSRQLKEFEDRLGVVLFERLPRGMRLTHAGEVMRVYAARLFEVERAAEAAMREISTVSRGELSIGASNTIGTYVLPSLLATYRQRYPDIAVSLFVGNSEQVAEGVADLRFSIGFTEGPLRNDGLKVQHFMHDEIVPVVAAGHPLARGRRFGAAALDTAPLLMREAGSGTRELVAEMLASQGIKPTKVMYLGNTEALKQAVLSGGGIGWLPRLCMVRELADGRLLALRLPKLAIRRPLNILRMPGAYVSPAGSAFLELLQKTLVAAKQTGG